MANSKHAYNHGRVTSRNPQTILHFFSLHSAGVLCSILACRYNIHACKNIVKRQPGRQVPEYELILTRLQARMYHPGMATRRKAGKQNASKPDEMGKYASSFASLGGK